MPLTPGGHGKGWSPSPLGLFSCLAGETDAAARAQAGGSPAIQSREKASRRFRCQGTSFERDPADKEIFKVQLMSEMSHWLNETKVRLENKKPSLQGAGLVGMQKAEDGA